MRTGQKVKAQFALPELHDDRMIEWNLHVTKSSGPCDMIIGRDILRFLKIDSKFSEEIVECNAPICPQLGHAQSILMRDSQGREQDALLTKDALLSAWD